MFQVKKKRDDLEFMLSCLDSCWNEEHLDICARWALKIARWGEVKFLEAKIKEVEYRILKFDVELLKEKTEQLNLKIEAMEITETAKGILKEIEDEN